MSTRTAAPTRYGIRFGLGAVVYSVLMLVARPVAPTLAAPWSHLVAMSPTIGVIICAWALYRFVTEIDEYQRLRMMSSLALSIVLTVVIGFAYGSCESVGAPHIGLDLVPALWATCFGLATLWQAVRDRMGDR